MAMPDGRGTVHAVRLVAGMRVVIAVGTIVALAIVRVVARVSLIVNGIDCVTSCMC